MNISTSQETANSSLRRFTLDLDCNNNISKEVERGAIYNKLSGRKSAPYFNKEKLKFFKIENDPIPHNTGNTGNTIEPPNLNSLSTLRSETNPQLDCKTVVNNNSKNLNNEIEKYNNFNYLTSSSGLDERNFENINIFSCENDLYPQMQIDVFPLELIKIETNSPEIKAKVADFKEDFNNVFNNREVDFFEDINVNMSNESVCFSLGNSFPPNYSNHNILSSNEVDDSLNLQKQYQMLEDVFNKVYMVSNFQMQNFTQSNYKIFNI
jgi:hypothetical protein